MRGLIPLALLNAGLVAGFATAQMPLGVMIDAQGVAQNEVMVRHDGPGGTEVATMPAGTVFSATPQGPMCPCWPAEGAGAQFWVVKDQVDFAYHAKEKVRALGGETAEVYEHDNQLQMSSPGCLPATVEVSFDSLVDSENYRVEAFVEVVGWGTIYHDFAVEHEKGTVPVILDRKGLMINIRTHLYVDNATAPTFQGLVELDIAVSVAFPAGSYTTGGAGCAGTNGVPELAAKSGYRPVIGMPFDVMVKNLPLDPAKPAYGFLSNARLAPQLELGPYGMPGCALYVYSPVAWPLSKIAGEAQWTVVIPRDLSLVNATFYQQVFALDDPSVNALGAVLSNYGEATIGVVPVFLP